MVSSEAKIAIQTFLSSFGVFSIIFLINLLYNITCLQINLLIIITSLIVTVASTKYIYHGYAFQIAIRSTILGALLAIGIYIRIIAPSNIRIFGSYMSVTAFFHYSEFLSIAIVQPKQVSIDSFVINHSIQYTVAAISSVTEFFVESYFFPSFKEFYFISNIGLTVCIAGEILRKVAILTAGSNFNHLVQCEKAKDHTLVTHGVYSWFRHPSYVGWFYWSIGTQLTLLNPICAVGYALASWSFFNSRIHLEEIMLLNFFGQQYCDYQQDVGTGLPFIEGYKI